MVERAWHRFWEDVSHGENIELYFTVALSVFLVLLNLAGRASVELTASLTLVVLGLLAISLLKSRYLLEEISDIFEDGSRQFLKPRTEIITLEEGGKSASEIVIVGISLLVLYQRRVFFEEKLRQGCHLRFLLLDPQCQAIETFNLMTDHQTGVLRDIANAFDSLEALARKMPDKIEARLASVFLPYGIVAFDPSHRDGMMTVEPLAYKVGLYERPHFVIRRKIDGYWFEYFQNQYEQLWEDSKEWVPGMSANITP